MNNDTFCLNSTNSKIIYIDSKMSLKIKVLKFKH